MKVSTKDFSLSVQKMIFTWLINWIITRLQYLLNLRPLDFPDVSADASLGNFLEDLSEHFDVFLAFGEFVATIRLHGFVWYCLYFGETQSVLPRNAILYRTMETPSFFFFLPSSFMKYVHEAVETGPIKAWRDITEEAGSQVCNLKTNQLDYFSKWYTSLQHWDFFHISLAANLQLEQIKSVEVTGSQICSIHVHTCTCMYVCLCKYLNSYLQLAALQSVKKKPKIHKSAQLFMQFVFYPECIEGWIRNPPGTLLRRYYMWVTRAWWAWERPQG